MNDAEAVGWRNLREFSAVDLSQSFVVSWHVESETLMVDVDLFLLENHPFFERPRPNEKVCIRQAIIEFPHCEKLLHGGEEVAIGEAAASVGQGAINDLRRLKNGRYEISGEFGTVLVDAERPLLRLKGR